MSTTGGQPQRTDPDLDDLVRFACLAAAPVAIAGVSAGRTGAEITRVSVRAALECLLGNGLVQLVPRDQWPEMVALDPPYQSWSHTENPEPKKPALDLARTIVGATAMTASDAMAGEQDRQEIEGLCSLLEEFQRVLAAVVWQAGGKVVVTERTLVELPLDVWISQQNEHGHLAIRVTKPVHGTDQ